MNKIVNASCKCNEQLKVVNANEITRLIDLEELETGSGLNQIGTTERAFSTMKVVKTNIRNKMENDFLTDSLMLYIEKDIVSTFSLDSIVDDFENLKERQVPFS